MPTFLGFIIVILILAVLQVPAKGAGQATEPPPPNSGSAGDKGGDDKMFLSRDEITRRLQALDKLTEEAAKLPPPPMAMCYKPSMRQMDPADYICPTCGTKTSFTKDDMQTMENIRQEFKSLKGVEARLNETSLCAKCCQGKPAPQLILEIKVPGAEKAERTPLNQGDLTQLSTFLKSSDWKPGATGRDAETLAARIHRLLGIPGKNNPSDKGQ